MDDNGEDDEEIDDGDHDWDKVLFLVRGGFAGLGEKVPRVLDVEDSSDT